MRMVKTCIKHLQDSGEGLEGEGWCPASQKKVEGEAGESCICYANCAR